MESHINNFSPHQEFRVIYDMSEDTKVREAARLREKALHDEASALKEAERRGEANIIAKMKSAGMSDSEIQKILSL